MAMPNPKASVTRENMIVHSAAEIGLGSHARLVPAHIGEPGGNHSKLHHSEQEENGQDFVTQVDDARGQLVLAPPSIDWCCRAKELGRRNMNPIPMARLSRTSQAGQ